MEPLLYVDAIENDYESWNMPVPNPDIYPYCADLKYTSDSVSGALQTKYYATFLGDTMCIRSFWTEGAYRPTYIRYYFKNPEDLAYFLLLRTHDHIPAVI